jgi:hypothetical protein
MTATKLVPISQALGHLIACPCETGEGKTCGHPAMVKHARGRVLTKQIMNVGLEPGQIPQRIEYTPPNSAKIETASQWYTVECSKSGNKLYKANTPVEVVG